MESKNTPGIELYKSQKMERYYLNAEQTELAVDKFADTGLKGQIVISVVHTIESRDVTAIHKNPIHKGDPL